MQSMLVDPPLAYDQREANMHEVRVTRVPDASRPNGWLVYPILDYRWQGAPSPRP